MKIGFFDSGLGGLTILKAVAKAIPQYDYLFYGDTANLPYGDKSEAEIYELSKIGMRYLFAQDCTLVIIACNTASAETARKLQNEFLPTEYPDRKILGVIVPTIETLNFTKETKVVLLATKRTVDSNKYQIEIRHKNRPNILLSQIAIPELVPLIEKGNIDEASKLTITNLKNEAGEAKVIILGCTHYTQMKDQLRKHLVEMEIISQDEVIPEKLQEYLDKHPEVVEKLSQGGTRNIFLTKHRSDYDRIMGQMLQGRYLDEVR